MVPVDRIINGHCTQNCMALQACSVLGLASFGGSFMIISAVFSQTPHA